MKLTKTLLILFSGVFLLALDRWLKWQALHAWSEPVLINKFLGWQPFFNSGVAFGLPMPNLVIIILTVLISLAILVVLIKNFKFFGVLILFGAISNLFDRLIYHYAVDYLRVVISMFNLADIMIVAGFIMWFVVSRFPDNPDLRI